jgi:twinkle protein
LIESDRLKEILGSRAKDIIASGLGLQENKQKKVLCPLHSENTPSMNWHEPSLCYVCHGCGGNIDIYKYYTDFENMSFKEAMAEVARQGGTEVRQELPNRTDGKVYVKPNITTRPLSKEAIDYMAKRKISKDTLDSFKVVERDWNGQPVYVFQYFNEQNKLDYVTYRSVKKGGLKGGCEPNTKPILWGMWMVDKTKPVVITEGQPDAMAVYESGYHNVLSIPSGVNNFAWIENCWDFLQELKEIIIFADNDKPGIEFAQKTRTRLKNVKIIYHPNRKDANEVLYYEGSDVILNMIISAIKQAPEGIIDVSKMEYSKPLEKELIETGFRDYDAHVEDLKTQEITIIFGRNGEGKTTFISQIISHCLYKEVPVFLYSGEMSDFKIQDWLYRQIIGNGERYLTKAQGKYKMKVTPNEKAIKAIKKWHEGCFYLYDRSIEKTDVFFQICEMAIDKYGIRMLIIDNLMSVLEENADSLLSDQANFVQKCKLLAVRKNIHVILLAHPNKTKTELENQEKGNLEKTDISGTNNIPNKADNVITVERLWGNERKCDAIITSHKDRESGQRLQMNMQFSSKSLRFYNDSTKEHFNYGWEMYYQEEATLPSVKGR